jgi:hypothetical protein
VFDEPGNNEAQLGTLSGMVNRRPTSSSTTEPAHQTNLDGEPDVQGDEVVIGTFPKASENLGDFDVAQWNAALTRNGNDIAARPDLNGDEIRQPFPG